jgi:putative polyketide hydroxylase
MGRPVPGGVPDGGSNPRRQDAVTAGRTADDVRRDAIEAPVLIVGAGPAGLSLAVSLSRAGVRSALVERHPGTSIHPKARGVNVRTTEILRQWDLAEAAQAAGISAADSGFFFRGPSLAAPEFRRFGGGGKAAELEALSPEGWLVIAQDALEPVLLDGVRRLGLCDVRFRHELISFATDDEGVLAEVLDREAGRRYRVRARYLVGADGAASPTREGLGVQLVGHGPLVHNASILFRADLAAIVADRRSAVYYIVDDESERPRGYPMSVGNPPPAGVFLAINNTDRWLLVIGHDGDESLADLDDPTCVAAVRRAVGVPDLQVEVLSRMPWTPAARVAERYGTGRVFLAGDAAHEMTPSGAFGLNTGMADAHNLGWKLAAVLQGWAGPGLLETYDTERRPVGHLAAGESYRQFADQTAARPFGNWGVIFGAAYASAAIEPDGTPAPEVADAAADYVPVARPGHRAPHIVLRTVAGERSILDAFGDGFALVTRSADWAQAGETVAGRTAMPLAVTRLGGSLAPADPGAFERLYGIGDDGLVLVRPDGHVGWRVLAGGGDASAGGGGASAGEGDASAGERLDAVLGRILDRPG